MRQAIRRGVAFIVRHQRRDGTWRDFRTLAGESDDWTTAYVGAQLISAGVGAPALRRAVRKLVADQHEDGGWGYNSSVPSDADSTAWTLLVLATGMRRSAALTAAARRLMAHQHRRTGGVRTYAHPAPILRYMWLPSSVSVAGWMQSQIEVTATAGRAFAAVKNAPSAPAAAAWRFVREHQGADGEWPSYWWTTPLYAMREAVALAAARPDLRGAAGAVDRAVRWTIDTQRADGGWGPRSAATPRAFDTALAVAVITHSGQSRPFHGQLLRGVKCLCAMQLASGEWPTAPILRIPPPGVRQPDRYRRWRVDELGTGVVLSDQHLLFTTATVVAALARAERVR